MIIIDEHDKHGWITCYVAGRWVQAKVFSEGSTYGINNGRVSKLSISKNNKRDAGKPFHPQMDYNYDRGLEFDNLPDGMLDKIVQELEALPTSYE